MRSIRIIGIINIIVGIIALLGVLKFYSAASSLFTSEVSPPFGPGAIKTAAFYFAIPGFILILNGAALYALGSKLSRVPEFKAFSKTGEYMGRLKGVEIEEGVVDRFEVEGEGRETKILQKEDLTAVDDVVLIKGDEGDGSGKVRHELVGKEVYTKRGGYYGKVESVTLDGNGDIVEFLALKGMRRKIVKYSDVESGNGVIIVK